MDTVPIKFSRASYVDDELPIESMILMVNMGKTGELMSLFCADKEWIVTLSDGQGVARIGWDDFVKIFAEFSLFVAQQGLAMVEECEEQTINNNDSQ